MSEKLVSMGTHWRGEQGPDGVWTLWFDCPERKLNVLDQEAFDDLDARLDQIEASSSARGLLVRSSKDRGFCAGADLKSFLDPNSAVEIKAYLDRGLSVIERLSKLAIPTTAVLHGVCLGGGLELALACRCRVALASSAPFQMGSPEIQFGLIPAWGALVRLPRLIAARDALNLLLAGNPLGFLQAKSLGLVHRLVTVDEQDRINETLERTPIVEGRLTGDHWESELKFAAARAADQPSDFPEAQEAILDLIRLDLKDGPEAARQAAVVQCGQLAGQLETRDAIADFFTRRQHSS